MLRRILAMLAVAGSLLAQRSPLDAAWDLAAKGQPEKAADLLEKLIRKEPGNGDARLLLGSLLAVRGDFAGAIVQLKEGVRLLPNSAEGHNSLGEAFNSAKDAAHAREEFEKAVQINPKLAQAQVNLGMVLA
ncbi:MAG: tetratricopeptide repeat protein, partial [Bryobacteraceae bacterium]